MSITINMDDEIVNAKIEKTFLGLEDHGIMTAMLTMTWGCNGQGFGGYCLKHSAMYVFVNGVLKAVGVEQWEDLKGKYVRLHRSGTQGLPSYSHREAIYLIAKKRNLMSEIVYNGKIDGIGHIVEERWFYPEKAFADYKKTLNDKGEPK